jgi:uroporphyrin-III C-methyltransferase
MGIVYLVGAGPGDPGLLTLRAAKLLRRADVVVHDALVSERILRMVRNGAELIDVGKRSGHCRTSQAEIHRLLIAAATRADRVVRLKGGDPFIFGRGGEEAEALRAAGVRFRVVPGVTAAIGAAACAGIPLTHRDLASAVTFVTAHECDRNAAPRVNWESFGRQHGTLAIYMGASQVRAICQRLLGAGRDPATPAAFIEWGTCPQQRTVTGSLRDLAERVEAAGLGSPAIIVVGPVAALHERLSWFEPRAIALARVG